MLEGDLGDFFTVIASNLNHFALLELMRWLSPIEWYRWFQQKKQNSENTVEESEKQIDTHYNIGNDWYTSFLDTSMTYTSARFENEDEPLEQAQKRKRDLIIKKSLLEEGENKRVLDIGCGFGTLCNQISGIPSVSEVVGICNSIMMIDYCKSKFSTPRFVFSDYRTYEDKELFDVITSVEMLEAIGVANFREFADICNRLLKPKGRVVIQVITAPIFLNNTVRRRVKGINETFVTTYIFPGGQIMHIEWLHEAFHRDFVKVHCESFGKDYAKTLRTWRSNLIKSRAKGDISHYPETLFRTFEYYLAWCEGGFASECLDVHQIVFEKRE